MFLIWGKSANAFKEICVCFCTFEQIRSYRQAVLLLSAVGSRRTNFIDTRVVPKPLVKLTEHEPTEMSSSLATSLKVRSRSVVTKPRTFAITSSTLLHDGCPQRSSLSTDVYQTLERRGYSKTSVPSMASS